MGLRLTGAVLCVLAASLFAAPALATSSNGDKTISVPSANPVRPAKFAAAIPVPTPNPLARAAKPVELAASVPVPTPNPRTRDNSGDDDDVADDMAGDGLADDPEDSDDYAAVIPFEDDSNGKPTIVRTERKLYCVQYARERSGFNIHGDARLWWERAVDFYDRAATPSEGAVMVFSATKTMKRGHVAVVTHMVSAREIIVDHANWMRDGNIYLNMPVMDVSAANDWSAVRVWNARDNQWGARTYRLSGFVVARPVS